jgi:hypothetical protein
MSRKIKKYGWIPDLPDHRPELKIALHVCSFSRKRERVRERAYPQPLLAKLLKKVDLRPKCPPVFNQKNLSPLLCRRITSDLAGVVFRSSRIASSFFRVLGRGKMKMKMKMKMKNNSAASPYSP